MISTLLYIAAFGLCQTCPLPQAAKLVPVEYAQEKSDIQFFVSIQDMPLMPGQTELPEQMVVFDKPEGRIVEALALLERVEMSEARDYYAAVLPQFGWAKRSDDIYVRENELLSLKFENHQGQSFMRIMVSPRTVESL